MTWRPIDIARAMRHHHLVARVLAPAALLPLLAALATHGPWAPRSLEDADTLARTGDLAEAVAAYDRVATWSPFPSDRRTAAWRAAMTLALAPGHTREAVERFGAFADDHPGSQRGVAARVRQAGLLAELGDDTGAAAAYAQAARELPANAAAFGWMMAAGDLLHDAGQLAEAQAVFEEATHLWPERAAEARLEQARILLQLDRPAEARALFEQVAAESPEHETLARLGISRALEQEGSYDAALAELEEVAAELPEAVAMRKRMQLRRARDLR